MLKGLIGLQWILGLHPETQMLKREPKNGDRTLLRPSLESAPQGPRGVPQGWVGQKNDSHSTFRGGGIPCHPSIPFAVLRKKALMEVFLVCQQTLSSEPFSLGHRAMLWITLSKVPPRKGK